MLTKAQKNTEKYFNFSSSCFNQFDGKTAEIACLCIFALCKNIESKILRHESKLQAIF